jgi:hypothetical protein
MLAYIATSGAFMTSPVPQVSSLRGTAAGVAGTSDRARISSASVRGLAGAQAQGQRSRRRVAGPAMMADGEGIFGGISSWIKKAVDENMYGPDEEKREKPKVCLAQRGGVVSPQDAKGGMQR